MAMGGGFMQPPLGLQAARRRFRIRYNLNVPLRLLRPALDAMNFRVVAFAIRGLKINDRLHPSDYPIVPFDFILP